MGSLRKSSKGKMLLLLTVLLTTLSCVTSLSLFGVYWESYESWKYTDDEQQHNPWHIALGNINAGLPGNAAGPSVVNIAFADTCVSACQEEYPDEFCDQYPPEGIPAKPRTVDDWGTKFNITSSRLARDIPKLQEKGAKINLSYGYDGLAPYAGGGVIRAPEDVLQANLLATRMKNNIKEWDLDGVDIFTMGIHTPGYTAWGRNIGFHSQVIKSLRGDLPPGKTISYTIQRDPCEIRDYIYLWNPMHDVIALSHKYLDSIYIELQPAHIENLPDNEECVLNLLINELRRSTSSKDNAGHD